MKYRESREYRNKHNGLIYWLEDGAVMVRHPETGKVMKSNYTSEVFFIALVNDILVLIEE